MCTVCTFRNLNEKRCTAPIEPNDINDPNYTNVLNEPNLFNHCNH